MRLDEYLVKNGLAKSRERAKELIKEGGVSVGGKTASKPSLAVGDGEEITVSGGLKYVSRGGLKLEKALDEFGISVAGRKCVDLGASAGGFTDCMLQRGAAAVYALDSGHGQLDGKLLEDSRVISREGFNVRYMTCDDIDGKADFLCCDLSFISLELVIPRIAEALSEEGEAVLLIKPQFECGRENIGKNGIVRSPTVHRRVLEKIFSALNGSGLTADKCIPSPIKGGSGNIEYLAHAVFSERAERINFTAAETVSGAFAMYAKK